MWAAEAALTKRVDSPTLLEVKGLCSYTDYILILSGRSVRQAEAIALAVAAGLKQHGCDALGREGGSGGQWQLLDYGDLVVHIFVEPLRGYYDLEGLWADAVRVPLEHLEAPVSAHGSL